MVRFIFGCGFVLALSILAVPVYYGISKQKNTVTTTAAASDSGLSFDEIYALADENGTPSAASLNAIETAAGESSKDQFTTGFQNTDNPALPDTPAVVPELTIIEQENSN